MFKLPQRFGVAWDGGSITSFRWGNYGCDVFVVKNQFKLFQWGRRGGLAKFLCMMAKPEVPRFLLNSKWVRHFVSKKTIAGETTKPLPALMLIKRQNGVQL